MRTVDWRELYASNRAVIERAGLRPGLGPAPLAETTSIVAGRTRRTVVHAPANLEPGIAAPLVCMLHGCTQDAASFAAATRMNEAADRHGFIAVYPQQDRGENAQCCWNWFERRHQARGAGEPASIAAVVRELIGTTSGLTIDPRRVFVAGLSAGGAMAAILAATYPDLFAAVAVHSGLAYGSATGVAGAFKAMARGVGDPGACGRAAHAAMGELARPVPSLVIHGSADRTVAAVNGEQVLAQSMAANRLAAPETCDAELARPAATERGQVRGGHAYEHARWTDRRGALMHEWLTVEGMGHAWSGGAPGASYTDPRGPDASEAIWRFFSQVGVG